MAYEGVGGSQDVNKEELFADYRLRIISALDKNALLTEKERKNKVIDSLDILLKRVIEAFPVEKHRQIVKAVIDMVYLHAGQKKRLSGELVIEHLLKTAYLLFGLVKDVKAEEVVVALLHDAIEDRATDVIHTEDGSFEDGLSRFPGFEKTFASMRLSSTYGKEVEEMLNLLIKPDYEKDMASMSGGRELTPEEFNSLKSKLYISYLSKALSNPNVCMIKLADFIANSSDVDSIPDEHGDKRESIKSKYYGGFAVVLEKLQDPSFKARLKDPDKLQVQMAQVFANSYERLTV